MKYQITARELLNRGLWDKFCEVTGTNEWAVAEGLMDESDEETLTQEQAERIGLVAKKRSEEL